MKKIVVGVLALVVAGGVFAAPADAAHRHHIKGHRVHAHHYPHGPHGHKPLGTIVIP